MVPLTLSVTCLRSLLLSLPSRPLLVGGGLGATRTPEVMLSKEKPPTGLSAASRSLWKGIIDRWDLRPDELTVLERACRAADAASDLRKVVDREGLTVLGSMGQTVVHPALQEARQQDALATTLLRSLRLPDDESETKSDSAPGERSAAARSAAKSRWTVHHGAVA